MDNADEIVDRIIRGGFDLVLHRLQGAIDERKRIKNHQTLMSIRVGDRVKVIAGRPQYLKGALATVRKVNYTKVVIDFDTPHEKFHRNVTCPVSILEVIPPQS